MLISVDEIFKYRLQVGRRWVLAGFSDEPPRPTGNRTPSSFNTERARAPASAYTNYSRGQTVQHILHFLLTGCPQIDEQRRALDANGLRYVISMRSFYILNQRVKSDPNSPQSNGVIPRQTGYRERLRYRDMVWAFHSESQELLLNTSTTACNGKMCWSDARALGIFIWLRSVESMVCPFFLRIR